MVVVPFQLPIWIQYLQALALVLIPIVGAWIAWQQKELARVRLRHDLYDRRIKVFEAARALLLREVLPNATASDDGIRAFVRGTADAVFVLDDQVSAYFDEMVKKVIRLQTLHRRLADRTLLVGEERSALAREDEKLFEWFTMQYDVVVAKFKPFLTLRERSWPWLS